MNRRGFLRGASALLFAAPAIVRASSLMAISPMRGPFPMVQGEWYELEWSETIVGWGPPQIYRATPTLAKLFLFETTSSGNLSEFVRD